MHITITSTPCGDGPWKLKFVILPFSHIRLCMHTPILAWFANEVNCFVCADYIAMNSGVGACRGKDSSDWGRWGTDYILFRAKDEAACKSECNSRSDCKAIEIKKGLIYCKVWLIEPLATSTSTSYQCLIKVLFSLGCVLILV